MANALTKEQREEALKKVAEVLEEAMAEYEQLEKMDLEMAEDPTRPFPAAAAAAEGEEEDEKDKDESEEDEDKDKEEDDEDEDKEEEMSDDAMKSEYAAFTAKMEARGLLKKSEEAPAATPAPKAEEVKKSEEAAPAAQGEDLKKSIDDRFEALNKAVAQIAETVNKIAAQPAPKKGVSGIQPLKKTEEASGTEAQPLNKAEVVNKLLELKKGGNKQVTTDLIMRIETNRVNDSDLKTIKGFLG